MHSLKKLSQSFICLVLPMCMSQNARAELVAHWPLNDGQGTIAKELVAGNDGFVPTGVIPEWTTDVPTTGFANPYALRFDRAGQSFVETPFEGIGGDTARTISAWVKTSSTATQGIVGYGDTSQGAKWHFNINGDGDPRVPGAPRTESSGGNLTGDMSVADGQWHHVVSVFPSQLVDNEEVLHYVDGVLQGTTGVTPMFIDTLVGDGFPTVTIGARQNAPPAYDSFMDGFIDDVRMYNRALSVAEIQGLAQNPTTQGLVAHWPMDDGPGSLTVAETIAQNNGILRSAGGASIEWANDGPPGIQNSSARFTGDEGPSYFETTFEGIGGSDARTITLWVKAETQPRDTAMVAYGALQTGRKWHFRINQGTDSLRTEYMGGQNFATEPITDGEWHFVASVFPEGAEFGSEILHFLDGEYDDFAGGNDQPIDTAIAPEAGAFPVNLGFAVGHPGRFFVGQMADVRFYNEELSKEQLIEIMMGGGNTLPGDYNRDGLIDAADADAQAVAMSDPAPDLNTFDENNDGVVNEADRTIWVHDHAKTWLGDANLDGEFTSGDFVGVFLAGLYETNETAGWAEGDWNGDRSFSSGDFVVAFLDGGYENGPRPAAVVPEPSSLVLTLLGALALLCRRTAKR